MTSTTNSIGTTNTDLLDHTVIAHLASARPDGSLQSNPVWFAWDGTHIKMSTTKARQKMRNLGYDPHVALSITDPQNPYRYLEVRGVVDRIDDDPDGAFIDELSQRYMGKRPYPYDQPEDERVVICVRPTGSSAAAA
jgi:hypothetical protein